MKILDLHDWRIIIRLITDPNQLYFKIDLIIISLQLYFKLLGNCDNIKKTDLKSTIHRFNYCAITQRIYFKLLGKHNNLRKMKIRT